MNSRWLKKRNLFLCTVSDALNRNMHGYRIPRIAITIYTLSPASSSHHAARLPGGLVAHEGGGGYTQDSCRAKKYLLAAES
jgi:hypothetical protein